MRVVYTDIDPKCCAWLRELVAAGELPNGEVWCRDIKDIKPDEVRNLHQFHAFAGIGGWPHSLSLAGFTSSAWTASCPCQAHSSASRGRRCAEDLWAPFFSLVLACRPPVVFGEQVPKREWLDRLCDDMEAVDYQVRACVLPAYSVGQDHARERIYFACHADRDSKPVVSIDAEMDRLPRHRHQPREDVRENGLSPSMARARFGNAIIPQVAAAFVTACVKEIAA